MMIFFIVLVTSLAALAIFAALPSGVKSKCGQGIRAIFSDYENEDPPAPAKIKKNDRPRNPQEQTENIWSDVPNM